MTVERNRSRREVGHDNDVRPRDGDCQRAPLVIAPCRADAVPARSRCPPPASLRFSNGHADGLPHSSPSPRGPFRVQRRDARYRRESPTRPPPVGKPKSEHGVEAIDRCPPRGRRKIASHQVPQHGERTWQIQILIDLEPETIDVHVIGCSPFRPLHIRAAQTVQRGLRGIERLHAETQVAAVMRTQAQVTIRKRIDAPPGQRREAHEVATRLRHLAGIQHKEMTVHPEVGETGSMARLRLRDFIAVMHGDVIFSAAVNVEPRAQVFRRHRRAFDMPPGKPRPHGLSHSICRTVSGG